MSQTITAIFEDGVIRPLEEIELTNGEEVEVILVKKPQASPKESRKILSEIAALPVEGSNNGFSGEDHDSKGNALNRAGVAKRAERGTFPVSFFQ